jgi:hypothetical protein
LLPLLQNLDEESFEYDENTRHEEEQAEELMHLVASSVRAGNEWEQRFDEAADPESGFTEYVKSASMVEGSNETEDGSLSLAQALAVFKEKEVVDSIVGEIINMREHGVMK